jgi:hypothetical protein
LLKRVFDIDIERCPHSGGALKIIAAIEKAFVITIMATADRPLSGTPTVSFGSAAAAGGKKLYDRCQSYAGIAAQLRQGQIMSGLRPPTAASNFPNTSR